MGIEMEPAHLENNLELSGKTEEAHPELHGNSAPIYPVEKMSARVPKKMLLGHPTEGLGLFKKDGNCPALSA